MTETKKSASGKSRRTTSARPDNAGSSRRAASSGSAARTGTGKKTGTKTARKTVKKSGSSAASSRGKTRRTSTQTLQREYIDYAIYLEIILWVVLAFSILLFVSYFGIGGSVGRYVGGNAFGLFGVMAYPLPFLLFFMTAFLIANSRSRIAKIKFLSAILLYFVLCGAIQMVLVGYNSAYHLDEYFEAGRQYHTGGGLIGGAILSALCPLIGTIGSAIVLAMLAVIFLILVTQKSIMFSVRRRTRALVDRAGRNRADHAMRRKLWQEEQREARRKEKEERRKEREDGGAGDAALNGEQKPKTVERKPSAVDFPLPGEKAVRNSRSSDFPGNTGQASGRSGKRRSTSGQTSVLPEPVYEQAVRSPARSEDDFRLRLDALFQEDPAEDEPHTDQAEPSAMASIRSSVGSTGKSRTAPETSPKEPQTPKPGSEETARKEKPRKETMTAAESSEETAKVEAQIQEASKTSVQSYHLPTTDLLAMPKKNKPGSSRKDELMEKAETLQKVFDTFGVRVTITDVTCGPSVTRFELIPEMGVKVNKILSLQDDIQLNLAAEEIRIEAPIPGKAAVGIEIPNDEKTGVMLRELLESEAYRKSSSRLTYVVGKDIGGRIIVSDIAKMPHLLVAGSTGSGKSVFINTLILSILYKAKPDEVKLIMIDPKVVELSVYNGIPHLLIPVVTEPKKAAGALNWAVAEMLKRYQQFSEVGVRDMKSFNKRVAEIGDDVPEETRPKKMPQIVIIVDELADLMMVASNEVEDAIVRLTQLARAAGIHLVIATQRPSVDVITGLIKANMPSRIAFAVSSGVDSRTILDHVGAEKLLGMGDMLFSPQSYKQPLRIQGAFVGDAEVAAVVDYIKQNNGGESMEKDLAEQMKEMEKSIEKTSAASVSDRDDLFEQAGKFIIEKDKASIGMLQRWFKIGFNRAARIMDQLSEAGVVGPEEGTKPRKVEMSMEQFENYLEQN